MHRRARIVSFLFLLGGLLQPTQAAKINWVEVDWFNTHEEAIGLRNQLVAEGYNPVCVYPRGGVDLSSQGRSVEHSVRVGEFQYFMDAVLLQEDLASIFPRATVRFNSLDDEETQGRRWAFRELSAPERPHEIFELSNNPFPQGARLRFHNASAAILEGGMITPERASSQASEEEAGALSLYSASLTDTEDDPARGYALLRLGDIRASQGDLQRAREVLVPVARGDVAAGHEERYEAMWLLARIYHAIPWRTTAYRAYMEIATVAEAIADRALCSVEQVGLLMELAQSGQGTLEDCRLAASRHIAQFGAIASPEIQQSCATVALMSAESWYYERNYERCLRETRQVASEYRDFKREWGVAQRWQGYALRQLDRNEEAIVVLREIVESPWNHATDDFPNYFGQALAALEIVRALDELGREEEADTWRNEIIERWPETRAAEHARRGLVDMDLVP